MRTTAVPGTPCGYSAWQDSPTHLVRTRKAGKAMTYDREAPGFSHMAWNASNREQADALYEILKETDARILDPPCEMNYSPGYYAVWFEDPDGMKL